MNDDIVDGWYKFLADCRRDLGYANSHEGGLEMTVLKERWDKECPGLKVPRVIYSTDERCYVLTNLSETKQR